MKDRARIDLPIVFVHTPRTGGITLASIMERQYGSENIFFVYANAEGDTGDALRELEALPEPERRRLKVLYGHHRFGIHRLYFDSASYVTLVREPVDRLVSYYHYVLENPAHYLHRLVVSRRMKLLDFVSSGASIELDNGQTRQISGRVGVSIGACTADMLTEAKENLERHFQVVGVLEQFDLSVLLMKRVFSWSSPRYERMNATRDRMPREAVSPRVERAIRETNPLDCELYEFACRRFERLVAAHGRESLERELHRMRRKQSIYRSVRALFHLGGT